jgi:hypothetical protein
MKNDNKTAATPAVGQKSTGWTTPRQLTHATPARAEPESSPHVPTGAREEHVQPWRWPLSLADIVILAALVAWLAVMLRFQFVTAR